MMPIELDQVWSLSSLYILVAGAFAAFTVDLLVYPLDTIKTRIQSPDYKRIYTNISTGAVNRSLFRGLYQGVGSVIIVTVPSSGAFFTTYESAKSAFSILSLPSPITNSASSAVAELVSCAILTPAEVLKQNAQVVSRSPSSTTHAFDSTATIKALKKFRRPSQLWRGYTALAARNLPFTAMQFPMFEHLKKMLVEYRQRSGRSSGTLMEKGMITAFAAGTAGSVAAVVTTPVDVVKTRIMLAAGDASGEDQEKKKKAQGRRMGGFEVGKEVWRTDGMRGLFRGGALRGAWTALGSGLYLGTYETGRIYLEGRRLNREEGQAIV
ncbi:hypothetical protein MMC20_004484 [Loxospora ochrophaea]|nr:hypothetical protein [Loxospora ochrophaea]